jgi:hypothetical protein
VLVEAEWGGRVRQLHVLGVSDEGDTLLLGTSATGKVTHRLPLDGRLRLAIRGQLTAPGSDRAESVLSPKEIQARLRAGATPDEVAKVARIPVARIMPYFAPVEAERERIVEEARRALLHRNRAPQSTQPLGEVVDGRLREVAGLKDDSIAWTARRRADGAWVVRLSYSARGGQRRAEWLWQPLSRELSALDVSATRLAAEGAAPKRKPVRRPAAAKAGSSKAGSTKAGAKKAGAKKAGAKKAGAKKASASRPAARKKSAAAAKKATRTAVTPKPAAAAAAKKSAAPKPAAAKATRASVAKKAANARKAAVTPKRQPARKPAATPKPAARPRVLEVVPDPIPIEDATPVSVPVTPVAVAPAPTPKPARRPGTRVPVPSWSDVLRGVTGTAAAAGDSAPAEPSPADDEVAAPRSSSGGRRRRT